VRRNVKNLKVINCRVSC